MAEVRSSGTVLVEDLVNRYQLSVETIRRDLRILHEKGLVRRNYGGAEKKEQTTFEMPYTQRTQYHLEQKEAIAKEVVQLLTDGDSVFLDGNTTGLVVSRHIPEQKELVIVTNSMIIALDLIQKKTRSKVYLAGGEVAENGMTGGNNLRQELKQYRFDKALFSCAGVMPKGLYFSKNEPQSTAQTLAELSNQLILIADSSKMNQNAFLFGLETKRIHTLVTDEGIPPMFLEKLRDLVERVIVARLE